MQMMPKISWLHRVTSDAVVCGEIAPVLFVVMRRMGDLAMVGLLRPQRRSCANIVIAFAYHRPPHCEAVHTADFLSCRLATVNEAVPEVLAALALPEVRQILFDDPVSASHQCG